MIEKPQSGNEILPHLMSVWKAGTTRGTEHRYILMHALICDLVFPQPEPKDKNLQYPLADIKTSSFPQNYQTLFKKTKKNN